jgi:predicted LPLAT superfamily acyltransferase
VKSADSQAKPESGVDASTDWTRIAERGTANALRFGAWFHETFGRRPMQIVLWGIAIYFQLFHRAVSRGSRQYLDRVWASPVGRESLGRPPGTLMVLRHIHSFAVSLYDRLVVWGGALDSYQIDHDGSEEIFELARQGRGALLLGAHLGSFEMLWFLSREYDLAVNVVVYHQNAQRVNQFFDSISPDVHIRAIGLESGSVRAAFEIKACIDRGEFVVILADRVGAGAGVRVADATFLGKSARFPMGPFLLAGTLGCPVLMALCVRTEIGHYQTVLRPLRDAVRVRRSEREKRAQELMGQYVSILETYCERHPLEWFNYFEFWGERP